MWIHMISGTIIYITTFGAVIAMLNVNNWTIPRPSYSHYYIGLTIFLVAFCILVIGYTT